MKELLEIILEKTTGTAGAKVCSLGEAWAELGDLQLDSALPMVL